MKVIAIIQARMSSQRLPGKVIKLINGQPMIVQIYNRVKKSKNIDEIIVATSNEADDDELCKICSENGINVFRGSLEDVLCRFYICAENANADCIVRLTGDNCLVDAELIDRAINIFIREKVDYLSYCKELPLGMSTEVFSFAALKKCHEETNNKECREHVTLYMYKNNEEFNCLKFSDGNLDDFSNVRLTVDTLEDFNVAEKIYENFQGQDFGYKDIISLTAKKPEIFSINSSIKQKSTEYKGQNVQDRS